MPVDEFDWNRSSHKFHDALVISFDMPTISIIVVRIAYFIHHAMGTGTRMRHASGQHCSFLHFWYRGDLWNTLIDIVYAFYVNELVLVMCLHPLGALW